MFEPATGRSLHLATGEKASLNWSGYVVAPAAPNITAVTSTFTVPRAGALPPGLAASWTGIGGYRRNAPDLIQAGTESDSLSTGGSRYYAWYELLPDFQTFISGCSGDAQCTVAPGDVMTVVIREVRHNRWSIAMTNHHKWSWSTRVRYASTHSSAEWILEAPTLLVAQTIIAPVGVAHFGPKSTYTAGGVTRTIRQGRPVRVLLTNGLTTMAMPSGLAANGQSFNACTYRSSCPTPAR